MARPQASGGRFLRAKFVTAPGAMKTDRPKITAETSRTGPLGSSTGKADPMAMPVRINASGRPEAWRASTGRQTRGDRQMLVPRTTQTSAMNGALAACSVIHADRKVR